MTDILTSDHRRQVVEKVTQSLLEHYAFPDIAEKMGTHIRHNLEKGNYDDCDQPSELGKRLTEDLHHINKDLHLAVYYAPQEAAQLAKKAALGTRVDDYESHWWSHVHSENFGLPKAAYLEGNIGYLDVRYFAPANLAGETVVAAMNFLARCDALIFDLRQCGGGDPYTVQLIESYLFSQHKMPKLLLSKLRPGRDQVRQIWTLPHVPGPRLADIPVYILTSQRTFSGGEDLAYTLKHHGRATIVGEITGGGAHLVTELGLSHGFVIILPNESPVHPVTHSNWEGTGVQPDIAVPRRQALEAAHLHAFQTLIDGSQDPKETRALQWYLQRVRASYQPFPVSIEDLKRYVGEYRGYEVKIQDGGLVLSRTSRRDDWEMVPISVHTFIADEDYNARFDLDSDGRVEALVWLGRDQTQEIRFPRTVPQPNNFDE